jgi:hypothetical protein
MLRKDRGITAAITAAKTCSQANPKPELGYMCSACLLGSPDSEVTRSLCRVVFQNFMVLLLTAGCLLPPLTMKHDTS